MDDDAPKQPPRTLEDALNICHRSLARSDVYFGHGTDNAWDEAVQLVLFACALPPDSDNTVRTHAIDADTWNHIADLLRRRTVDRVPLPYLTGKAYFAGLEFLCDERAIVPRSPLAELITGEFQPWYHGPGIERVLDLCCGGGCIGLATAHYFPGAAVDLVDVDAAALALARENVAFHGLQERVSVIASDLFENLTGQEYDLILCNPPYVDAADLDAMPAEFCREPELALGSGPDGLDITRKILASAGHYLRPHGLLLLEVGYTWPTLERAYPDVPFTWVQFAQGGEGVFALSAAQWQDYGASWQR